MRTLISTVIVLAAILAAFALPALASEHTPAIPRPATVLPDVTPVDLSSGGSLPVKAAAVAPRAAVKAPEAAKVWTCTAPHALENDATQTVRDCSFVAR